MYCIRSFRSINKNVQCLIHTRMCLLQTVTKTETNTDELLPPAFTNDSEKIYSRKINDIADQITQLTLLEVADLSDLLQKRLNIKAPMMNMPMMVQNPAQTEEAEDQAATVKSSFNVKLMKFDQSKKVQLIKEIKLLLPDMNLVQVKKFVESAPNDVKSDVSKDEAEEIKKALEGAGATIEIE